MIACGGAGLARRSGYLAGALLLATGLWGSSPAQAQQAQIEPEKAAAIRQLLELTRASELMLTSIETSLPAQKAASPNIPDEFWDEFTARLRADIDRFVELLMPLYDKYLSLEQVQQLIDFYRTPLGQHLAAVQPLLAQESMLASQEWGAQLAAEVVADLAKRGIVIR